MNLDTIAALFSQSSPVNSVIHGICTDSRELKPGHLFIALEGENFDGHDYVQEAENKGAAAVVVQRTIDGLNIPQVLVEDTLSALATIASAHRNTIYCPIIALTGSNGKTTVKEMIAAILPQPSLATKGNLNNHIGAPLSVLRLNQQHRYAVFELGANHPGEIAYTASIVKPHVTLVNNIAPAHIEGFGSIDGVARAKGEIYSSLPPDGTMVINDDDSYAHFWDDLTDDKKTVRFSINHPTDVFAQDICLDGHGCGHFTLVLPQRSAEIKLQVPGLHNVRNAVAAASCCYAVEISIEDIQRGLNQFGGVKGRLTVLSGKNQATIIDDTYNANLRSVLTALEFLAGRPGKKIFVFGDMGELGDWAVQHHNDVGQAARELGIDELLCCGKYSVLAAETFGKNGQHFASQQDLAAYLLDKINKDTTVLVKGSRSSAMEKIVHQLIKD